MFYWSLTPDANSKMLYTITYKKPSAYTLATNTYGTTSICTCPYNEWINICTYPSVIVETNLPIYYYRCGVLLGSLSLVFKLLAWALRCRVYHISFKYKCSMKK